MVHSAFQRQNVMRPDRQRVGPVAQACRRTGRLPAHVIIQNDGITLLVDRRGVDRRIGKHLGRVQILGFAVDVRCRTELDHIAVGHQGGLTAKQKRFLGFGCRIDHHRAAAGKELRKLVAQFLAQLVVEIGQWLVKENRVAFLHDRAGQRTTLLLAARQFIRLTAKIGLQLHDARRLVHAAVDFRLGNTGDFQRRGNIVIDRHVRVVDEKLVYQTDVALLRRQAGDILAIQHNLPGGQAVEAGHQLDQRGLPRTGFSEENVEVAGLQCQARFLDMRDAGNALAYIFEF